MATTIRRHFGRGPRRTSVVAKHGHYSDSEFDRSAYLAAVAKLRKRVGYLTKGYITIEFTESSDYVCEHCLRRRARGVYLVRYHRGKTTDGLISGHRAGDWTCEKCDPRITPVIEMDKLREIVAGD